jgi:hypothetical protein
MSAIPQSVKKSIKEEDRLMLLRNATDEDALRFYSKWTSVLLGTSNTMPMNVVDGISQELIEAAPYCGSLISIYQFNIALNYLANEVQDFIGLKKNNKIEKYLLNLDVCLGHTNKLNDVLKHSITIVNDSILACGNKHHGFNSRMNRFIKEKTQHLKMAGVFIKQGTEVST